MGAAEPLRSVLWVKRQRCAVSLDPARALLRWWPSPGPGAGAPGAGEWPRLQGGRGAGTGRRGGRGGRESGGGGAGGLGGARGGSAGAGGPLGWGDAGRGGRWRGAGAASPPGSDKAIRSRSRRAEGGPQDVTLEGGGGVVAPQGLGQGVPGAASVGSPRGSEGHRGDE